MEVVKWTVALAAEFESEFERLADPVKVKIAAISGFLKMFGPLHGRPNVDTLEGSRHPNMKEMRFSASDGEWRVAFAFDPDRRAILLVAGDKSGTSQKRFYRELLRKADERFTSHLQRRKGK